MYSQWSACIFILLYLWKLLVLYLRFWIKVLTTTIDVHSADISTDTLFHYCTYTNLACFAGAGGTINLACFAGATTIDAIYSSRYIYRLTHRSIIVLLRINVYGTCESKCFTRMRVIYDHVRDMYLQWSACIYCTLTCIVSYKQFCDKFLNLYIIHI